MSKFEPKSPKGSVPNGQSLFVMRYAIRWFKCKLKPPKKVCLDKTQPVNLEDLGPAARSRYDTGRIGRAGTSPDPVPNPPIVLKTTVTARHGPAIPIKVRAESRAGMTGIPTRALARSLFIRRGAWLPS